MRKFLAFAVLAAGFLALNQAFWAQHPTNREDRLADVTRILTGPAGSMAPSATADAVEPAAANGPVTPPAADRGTTPRLAAIKEATPAVTITGALPSSPPAAPESAPVAAVVPTITPWQTAVTTPPDVRTPAAGRDTDPAASRDTADGADGSSNGLIENIQAELKRVGCYDGPVDGSWGTRSKQALQRFIERANASLPVREPDRIQLSLLKSQPGAVCGTCPKGQTMSNDGACVPNAMLAKAPLKAHEPVRPGAGTNWQTAVSNSPADGGATVTASITPAPQSAPQPALLASRGSSQPDFSGRMSVGGPVTAVNPAGATPGSSAQDNAGAKSPSGPLVAELEPDDGGASGKPLATETGPAPATADDGPADRDGLGAAYSSLGDPSALKPLPSRSIEVAPRPKASARSSNRPRAAADHPSRSRDEGSRRFGSRGVRSVQSLFTHPLGRM